MLSKLVLSLNGNTIAEYALEKETMTIGRRPDNDITIDNLAISGRHCQVITILNESFLEDLQSTNGTYVNGESIKKHALKHGDVIGVGKHQLKYFLSESETTGMLNVSEHYGHDEIPAEVAQSKLQILNGENTGQTIEITKGLTTIGMPGIQVAAITQRPKGLYIIHIEGGTDNKQPIVNGESIGNQAYLLTDMDIIEIAGIKFQMMVGDGE